jgi:hypothetical protein
MHEQFRSTVKEQQANAQMRKITVCAHGEGLLDMRD